MGAFFVRYGVEGWLKVVELCHLADLCSKLEGLLIKLAGITLRFAELWLRFLKLAPCIPHSVWILFS